MGIEAEVVRNVFADPAAIWELLIDPPQWKTWWPDCVSATTDDSKSLREGSRIELVLQPRQMRMTLRPEVDLCTENKLLSLTHRSATIHSTATWQLVEKGDTVKVTAQIVFNGFLPFLITIAQQSSIVHFSLNNNLKGLKRAAERRY